MIDTYDEYYGSGKAEADWSEFIDAMFQYANQKTQGDDE